MHSTHRKTTARYVPPTQWYKPRKQRQETQKTRHPKRAAQESQGWRKAKMTRDASSSGLKAHGKDSPEQWNGQLAYAPHLNNSYVVSAATRLNVYVPPNHTVRPSPQCNERWWGHEGRILRTGISAHIKRPQSSLSSLCPGGHSQKRPLKRHQICQSLDLGLPSINCEKCLLFKPLSLPYLVIAAQVD